MRFDREQGEGVCLYTADRRGAPYVGAHLGLSGYCGPGLRWRFYNPTVHTGRLFGDGRAQSISREVRVPAFLVHAWRALRGRP
jgi:hypothetical protein